MLQDVAAASGAPKTVSQIAEKACRANPGARYQRMEDLRRELEALVDAPSNGSRLRAPAVRIAAGVLVLIAVLFAADAWRRNRRTEPKRSSIHWVTDGTFFATDPAISPDGKLLAYASDRAGAGNLDIWVQPIAGGSPVRITSGPENESEPSFSADASRIAFRAEGEHAGIYVVPARGGEPRLIAEEGRNPRFAPDQDRIAYWVPGQDNKPAGIRLVSGDGGAPQPFHPELDGRQPVWSPDGNNILFLGQGTGGREIRDWWVAPVDGGRPMSTGAMRLLPMRDAMRRGMRWQSGIAPAAWLGEGVIFAADSSEGRSLWRLSLTSSQYQATDLPYQLTFERGWHGQAAASRAGLIAFTNSEQSTGLWMLPLRNSQVAGDLARIPVKSKAVRQPVVSQDGRVVVFRSVSGGREDQVMARDLTSGTESLVTTMRGASLAITPDGKNVIFEREGLNMIPVSGGKAEHLCWGCWSWDWTADGRLLVSRNRGVSVLRLDTEELRDVVRDRREEIWAPAQSPDGRWLAFQIDRRQVFVAPYRAGDPPPRDEWVPVTNEADRVVRPLWAADGRSLIYFADRDGYLCLWGQAMDRGRPAGDPYVIKHFHDLRRALEREGVTNDGPVSLARDKMVFSLVETTSRIGILDRDR
jgi:Tol biopolymer transport system component